MSCTTLQFDGGAYWPGNWEVVYNPHCLRMPLVALCSFNSFLTTAKRSVKGEFRSPELEDSRVWLFDSGVLGKNLLDGLGKVLQGLRD